MEGQAPSMIRPGSQNARLLDVLADGEWHVSRELHERCGYMRTNSRISELRAHGHEILGESVPGKTGTDGYRYRLVNDSSGEGAVSHVAEEGPCSPTPPTGAPDAQEPRLRAPSLAPTYSQLTFADVAA